MGFGDLGLGLGMIGEGDLTTTVLPNSFVQLGGFLTRKNCKFGPLNSSNSRGKKRKHLKLYCMLKFGGVFMIVRTTWKLIFDIVYMLKINPLNPKSPEP